VAGAGVGLAEEFNPGSPDAGRMHITSSSEMAAMLIRRGVCLFCMVG